ncbi:hypothetical protein SCOCK_330086 [Actinacidiphila cocklensis]|uniref:Uncharacterized protein n=1 Tax=Actinacidiphila cocklensis TaxID=887465 RepID=A0A9W4DQ42_9ACTN|nr:hypothetical protein SCOCK_330086 [Actinacidiphila cocklensis]
MVAGDRNGVPLRDLGPAVREDVRDQPQRRLRREDVRAPRDVLLQHVVLDRAGQPVGGHSLLLADELVEQQQQRGGRVDRHRRGHLVQRDAVEEHQHVVDRVDGDADLADLAVRDGRVRVVAHLGGQVEGDRQAHGAVGDQLLVARVGLRGGAEAGVLAHRPGPSGVHRRVDPPGERVPAGLAELLRRVPVPQRLRAVDRLDRQAAFRLARHASRLRSAGGVGLGGLPPRTVAAGVHAVHRCGLGPSSQSAVRPRVSTKGAATVRPGNVSRGAQGLTQGDERYDGRQEQTQTAGLGGGGGGRRGARHGGARRVRPAGHRGRPEAAGRHHGGHDRGRHHRTGHQRRGTDHRAAHDRTRHRAADHRGHPVGHADDDEAAGGAGRDEGRREQLAGP